MNTCRLLVGVANLRWVIGGKLGLYQISRLIRIKTICENSTHGNPQIERMKLIWHIYLGRGQIED